MTPPSAIAVLPCPFCGRAPTFCGSESEATCGCDTCGAPFFSGYLGDMFADSEGVSGDAFSLAAARWNRWTSSFQERNF